MKKNSNTPKAPAKVNDIYDAYALVKYFTAILGAAYHPEDRVKDYTYTDENGNTCPTFAPEVAARLQDLLDQAAEIFEAEGVDICAVRLTNVKYALLGFDVDALNEEFAELCDAHENDDINDVKTEESRAKLKEWAAENDDNNLMIVLLNAWDDLCSRHKGLRESGLDWWMGASSKSPNANPWDAYIGEGEEPDIF